MSSDTTYNEDIAAGVVFATEHVQDGLDYLYMRNRSWISIAQSLDVSDRAVRLWREGKTQPDKFNKGRLRDIVAEQANLDHPTKERLFAVLDLMAAGDIRTITRHHEATVNWIRREEVEDLEAEVLYCLTVSTAVHIVRPEDRSAASSFRKWSQLALKLAGSKPWLQRWRVRVETNVLSSDQKESERRASVEHRTRQWFKSHLPILKRDSIPDQRIIDIVAGFYASYVNDHSLVQEHASAFQEAVSEVFGVGVDGVPAFLHEKESELYHGDFDHLRAMREHLDDLARNRRSDQT